MIDGSAAGPLRGAHSVVPAGQMRGDEAAVVPVGQMPDDGPVPPSMGRLRKMFDEARDLTNEARTLQEKCQDYYDGPAQLSSEVRETLRLRHQPPIYDNRVKFAVNGFLGVLEQGRTDPRAYPRNPQDQEASDVATKVLRYVADRTSFHQIKMECAENYHIQGVAAAIIEWDGADISPNQIRWEEFFYDPTSRRNDFKDAKYLGIAKWMYAADLKALYPEAYARIGNPIEGGLTGYEATWDDRPEGNTKPWVDSRRARIMVVELYYRDGGEWLRCVYCAAGVLEFGQSAYRDAQGRTRCPIEAVSYYVDKKNRRYSPVVDMMPMQDEVNARRSRGLHLLNARQVQERELGSGAGTDVETVRTEMARADGVVPTGWTSLPTSDMASGNLAMLAEAKESLARMAPTPAVLGRQDSASASGRAKLVSQQAGMTELARGMGRFTDFEQRCYDQMWLCAQQFYTGPKWIRITDDTRAPEFLQINEPVMGVTVQPQIVGQDEVGQPVIEMIPAIGVVDVKNRIAELDMDIIVDAAPDTATLDQEVFEAFMSLVQAGADPFSPTFELLIEMSPMPDKARVLEKLKAKRDEIQQQQAEQAQAQAQMAAQAAQVDMANTAAQAGERQASAQLKAAQAQRENVLAVRDMVSPIAGAAE